jgi:hypothetical protein
MLAAQFLRETLELVTVDNAIAALTARCLL